MLYTDISALRRFQNVIDKGRKILYITHYFQRWLTYLVIGNIDLFDHLASLMRPREAVEMR